jgi:phosphatidylserine/phosphatidylglycerophosphate/cardiolipin synthase-like enzyme
MKKLVRVVAALAVLALGVVIAPPAQAKAPAPPLSYTPPTGAFFNRPNSSNRADQLILMQQIMNAVDSVPAGSYIRFVAYSFSYGPMVGHLLDAHKRGVNVRLLIDSHTETQQIRDLRSGLKATTPWGNKSYLKTCKYSCMSSKPSFIHSKLYLFSRVGNATHVSMMSSANVAETGISGSWNNTYTVANNKTLYDANVDNFNDMLPDTTNTNYYHTVTSGPYKAYFFPRAGSSPTSDTFYNVLSDVSCTGATGGYGSDGRTVIKLSTYTWTSLRLYLADKLTELAKKGCQIEVVYPGDNVDKEVATELLSSKKIKVYNGRNNGRYPHSKYLLINGVYQGVSQKPVYTASQNLTKTSLRESNEVMLRIDNRHPSTATVYGAYLSNFTAMKSDAVSATSAAAAARTTAGVESASEIANRDNNPDPDE